MSFRGVAINFGARGRLYAFSRLLALRPVQAFLTRGMSGSKSYQTRVLAEVRAIIEEALAASYRNQRMDKAARELRMAAFSFGFELDGHADVDRFCAAISAEQTVRSGDLCVIRSAVIQGAGLRLMQELAASVVFEMRSGSSSASWIGLGPLFAAADLTVDSLALRLFPAEQELSEDETFRMSDSHTKAYLRAARDGGGNVAKLGSKPSAVVVPVRYAAALLVAIVFVSSVFSVLATGWVFAVLLAFPVVEALLKSIYCVSAFSPQTTFMASYDRRRLVTHGAAVTLVIPILLHGETDCRRLAVRTRANAFGSASLARILLLTDFQDSRAPGSTKAEWSLLQQLVRQLEIEFHGVNVTWEILHRDREYCADEQVFMGWERKRGKIITLFRAVQGDDKVFAARFGHHHDLSNVDLIMVLDEDSRLAEGALDSLYLAATHPLNVLSSFGCSGHGIIVPALINDQDSSWRLSSHLATVSGTKFWIEKLGETAFAGKGLFSIREFHGRGAMELPLGCILSHDTLEGYLLRPGCCPAAVVVESLPASYLGHANRMHRWARGDFQNLVFAWPRDWRSFDFFRAIEILASRGSQIVLPYFAVVAIMKGHGLALAVVAMIPTFAATASVLIFRFVPRPSFVLEVLKFFASRLAGSVLRFVTAAHQSSIVTSAWVLSALRCIRKKHLLEWTSSDQAVGAVHGPVKILALSVLPPIFMALAIGIQKAEPPIAAVILMVVWLLFPIFSQWIFSPRRGQLSMSNDGQNLNLGKKP